VDRPGKTIAANAMRDRQLTIFGSILILCLGLVFQLSLFDRSFVDMDEGHLLAATHRLLHGDVLYRDIHTGILPGIYTLTAALFQIFGQNAIVTRWAQFGVNLAIVLMLWLLALRIARPRWALLAPLLFLALIPMSFPVWTMLNYSSVSVLFALAALLLLLRYLDSTGVLEGVLAGILLAACALTKQNFGALAGLTMLVVFLWEWHDSPRNQHSAFVGLLPVVLGGAAPSLITAFYFLSQSAFGDLIQSTFTQLLGTQLAAYNNPIPPIFGPHPANDGRFIFQYMPPSLFNYLAHGEEILGFSLTPTLRGFAIRLSYGLPLLALLTTPLLLWQTRRITDVSERSSVRAISLFAPIFFLGILPSAIWSHLTYVLPPTLLVVALAGDRLDRALRQRSALASKLWVGLVAALLLANVALAARVARDIRRWYPVPFEHPRMSLYLSPEQAQLYRGAAEFVEQCGPREEPIFTVPVLPVLYFLTDRLNPTRYDLLIPGDVHGELVVRDLELTRTQCMIYDPEMYLEYPPFETLFPELAHYIDTH